jgi:hypothetical protein
MRTVPEILDSIDGALADYAVSKDAMRWKPPPEDPEPEVCATVDPGDGGRLHIGAPALYVAVRPDMSQFEATMQQALGMLAPLKSLAALLATANQDRARRISAMHSDYARRRKARIRRPHG